MDTLEYGDGGRWAALRHHGDVDAAPGLLDFAVNVQGAAPPSWLVERLVGLMGGLGAYPSADHDRRTREAVAARHGRGADEVLLLAGGAEGFAMLPRLAPAHAAVIHPSFTEPELALREAGVPVTRVILAEPFRLRSAQVPESADLVVVGNPTNPTSVLHGAEDVLALRRPGRLLVVDEAFMDAIPGEESSLAALSAPDILVLRSLTKTWALAGLRCGYALGDPAVLARLARGRAHWPLGTLQLEAIAACSEPAAVAEAAGHAAVIAGRRNEMERRLDALGVRVHVPARAPFLLVRVPAGESVRHGLAAAGVAVRRCDTFPGLTRDHLRVAVRPRAQVDQLIRAFEAVTTRLAECPPS